MKKYFFASLLVSILLAPLSVFAVPGSTPPWVTANEGNPSASSVCSTQGGTPSILCSTKSTYKYTPLVNGGCPDTATIKVTKCDAGPARPATTAAPAPAPDTSTERSGFVPLTNIQAIKYVGNQNSLPDFLNSIYQVCIGLAAVIGVLQLMRAGLTWMTAGGSHEKIGEARGIIRDTLLGLLLVLAPTIVFSIINPSILKLEIGGLSELSLPAPASGGGAVVAPRNDLGQLSNAKNNLGGATIAPPSILKATGAINTSCKQITNGQIIDSNSTQANCCMYQESSYVQCSVQSRTNTDQKTISYCGCSIKPKIGMDYSVYYSAAIGPGGGGSNTKVGVVPGNNATYTALIKNCSVVGGKVVEKTLSKKLIMCEVGAKVPADTATTKYRCESNNVMCISQ